MKLVIDSVVSFAVGVTVCAIYKNVVIAKAQKELEALKASATKAISKL